MDRFALILAVLVAGALFPVQSVVNARLGESVGGPIWAAFASFAVGTMLLLACAYLVAGPPRLSRSRITASSSPCERSGRGRSSARCSSSPAWR